LTAYRRTLEGLGAERTLAFATSAVRDAENGAAFLAEIEWSYGFEAKLLSGHEEALLTFRGVSAGREIEEETLVLDVGGGSTELIVGGSGGVAFHESYDLGCVRLTERFLPSDPPRRHELDELGAAVRSLLAERIPDAVRRSAGMAIGVAGTITTLAALDLGLTEYDPERTHLHRIPAASAQEQLARLASLPLPERRRVPALDPDRAPVIVAGAAILAEVLDYFELDAVEASERDLLHGVALEAAALPEPVEGDAPPGAYTCC
jgi:exopolyphosphatase/guanosine-5'-triphosphate,3'-diphosphate pyrophosphatase